jgi:beta-glucosidase
MPDSNFYEFLQRIEWNSCNRKSILTRQILKGDWNFDGFVVSDWGSINEMIAHGYAKDSKQAAEMQLRQVLMDMESSAYVGHLVRISSGRKVSENLVMMLLEEFLK